MKGRNSFCLIRRPACFRQYLTSFFVICLPFGSQTHRMVRKAAALCWALLLVFAIFFSPAHAAGGSGEGEGDEAAATSLTLPPLEFPPSPLESEGQGAAAVVRAFFSFFLGLGLVSHHVVANHRDCGLLLYGRLRLIPHVLSRRRGSR